jgi:prolipoprotein diacylglyceryltransferase
VAFALVLFLGFWLLRKRWPFSGASFLMYVLLYFAGQFFLEFSRGDEAIFVGPWRLAQILDLVLALSAAAGLMVLWRRPPYRTGEADEPMRSPVFEGPDEAEDSERAESEEAEPGEARSDPDG